VIEVRGLTKRCGDHLAMDDVGWTVTNGEIFGVLGVNDADSHVQVD
jgi:ABC-2 type transport system ATP-binding protein